MEKLITQLAQVSHTADKYIAEHSSNGRFVGNKEKVMDQIIGLMKVNALLENQQTSSKVDAMHKLESE